MTDPRARNMAVFADTQQFYQTDALLRKAVEESKRGTLLYAADEYPELPVMGSLEELWKIADDVNGPIQAQGAAMAAIRAIAKGAPNDPVIHGQEIRLDDARTFEAAVKLRKEFPDKKIAVLNFASATTPGGGVKNGSAAQEEALCRCSTLYAALDRPFLWQQFYLKNRAAHSRLYSDALIYSPGVVICKTDDKAPKRLTRGQFVTVDVISCAAPNLRGDAADPSGASARIPLRQLYELQLSRARHVFHIAACQRADILVLGAFGCGAFRNDPKTVASAWRTAQTIYRERFDVIEYAVPKSASEENHEAFREVLRELLKAEP